MRSLLFILFFLPATCLAQYVITGKVFNNLDKTPVANASVFLNNSVAGSKTDDGGFYSITNVRQGQYDLVVSCVGFETLHQSITVNGDLKLADIHLAPKIMMLEEVHIKPKYNWAKNYELFKQHFLGTSQFAQQCKIITKGMPDILDLDYSSATGVLTAKSNDYFEIENKALGYKIMYSLQELTYENRSGSFYYAGTAAFEELKGSNSQKRRWARNRKEAYEGSSMHFLRSVIGNTLTTEGFKTLRLVKKTDSARKGSATIRLGGGGNSEPLSTLVSTPLNVNDFAKTTDVKGEYALVFKDCLYVMYDKKKAGHGNTIKPGWAENGWDDSQNTTLTFNDPYAFFDSNGIIINPTGVSFNGNWGKRLMAELLPVDYVEGRD